jgi:hypothetical protein
MNNEPLVSLQKRLLSDHLGPGAAKKIISLLLLVMAGGNADAQLHAKPVVAFESAYELDGYSVQPPSGKNWFELRRDRGYVYFGKKLASRTHSFIAIALSAALRDKFEQPEEFREYVIKMLSVAGDARNTVVENRAELDDTLGRYCVRYYIKAEDRDAIYANGRVLLAETVGVSCLHPDDRGLTVDVSYTQRGYPQEIGAELRSEGESFVRSLKFNSR